MNRQSLKNIARFFPILGAVLFFIPILWIRTNPPLHGDGMRTSAVMIYIFAVWLGLILSCICAYGRAFITPKDPSQTPEKSDGD